MSQRNAVGIGIATLLACIGVLSPMSVLYHEVRALVRQDTYPEGQRIAEFERFRVAVGRDAVALVEPSNISRLEWYTRVLLAQYALAPAMVSDGPDTSTRLINREVLSYVVSGRIEAEGTYYILERN